MQTNQTLQALVNKAARQGGGVVKVPAGIYKMHDALHLRSGVHLIGEPGTILQKVPSVTSALVPWIGFGQYEFAVEEPNKFAIGMGVIIADKNAFGFYETAATITGRKGDQFFIDRPLAHDYTVKFGGRVTSVFPLISGRGANDISIRNLTIDGNHPQEQNHINGCRGGGVFLQYSNRAVVDGVEVRNLFGDAISFQQCTDVYVRDCHLHHNRGGGLHPGSGTVRYVMTNNRIEHNDSCGIFYCLRTKYSICEDNLIAHNQSVGISIGERDTDHRLLGNVITGNGAAGILFREPFWESGDRVWIEGNILANNGGAAEIVMERGIHQVCITGNTIESRTGKAVHVGRGCSQIYYTGNSSSVITGQKSSVSLRKPVQFPKIGPQAAPLDAARHLNIEKLTKWRNL